MFYPVLVALAHIAIPVALPFFYIERAPQFLCFCLQIYYCFKFVQNDR
jgi:hypothetical protein